MTSLATGSSTPLLANWTSKARWPRLRNASSSTDVQQLTFWSKGWNTVLAYLQETIIMIISHKNSKVLERSMFPNGMQMGHNVRKRTFGHKRPVQIQICLWVRAVDQNLYWVQFGWTTMQRFFMWTMKFWSDFEDVQADLSLRWAHMSVGTLYHVELKYCICLRASWCYSNYDYWQAW